MGDVHFHLDEDSVSEKSFRAERECRRGQSRPDESPGMTTVMTNSSIARSISSVDSSGPMIVVRKQEAETTRDSRAAHTLNALADGGTLVAVLYAVIVVLLGLAFPLKDALQQKWLTSYVEAVFLAYIYGMSFVFIIFLEVYLIQKSRRHGHKPKSRKSNSNIIVRTLTGEPQHENQDNHNPAVLGDSSAATTPTGVLAPGGIRVVIEEAEEPPVPTRHTGLYTRFGVAIFGLGTLIYDGLVIKLIQAAAAEPWTHGCMVRQLVWPHYVHLAFLLVQTYFIFKYPEVHVTSVKPLARVGFMHLLATNVCVWFRTLIREMLDSFLNYYSDSFHFDFIGTTLYDDYDYDRHAIDNVTQAPVVHNSTESVRECEIGEHIMMVAGPILFPCVLEYSMLAIAVTYTMYAGVGTKSKCTKEERRLHRERNKLSASESLQQLGKPHPHMHVTQISFHKSHKGLLGGLVIMGGACVSTILFFTNLGRNDLLAETIYHITAIGLFFCVLSACLISGVQMRTLKFFAGNGPNVDDVLLIVGMAGMLLHNLLRLMSLLDSADQLETVQILAAVECVLALLVAGIQTGFILHASHRVSSTCEHLRDKPGRSCVIFLLLANVTLWLFKAFNLTVEKLESGFHEQKYGYLAWQLFTHTLIPVLIFYHYHASACCADIWSNSYSSDTIKNKSDCSSIDDTLKKQSIKDSILIFHEKMNAYHGSEGGDMNSSHL